MCVQWSLLDRYCVDATAALTLRPDSPVKATSREDSSGDLELTSQPAVGQLRQLKLFLSFSGAFA